MLVAAWWSLFVVPGCTFPDFSYEQPGSAGDSATGGEPSSGGASTAGTAPSSGMAGEPPAQDPCQDGVRSGAETDIDCGGQCAAKCKDGDGCAKGERDCQSGVCMSGVCQAPSCSDTVRNGTETDVDCGGKCKQCPPLSHCGANQDCASGTCAAGTCDSGLRVYYTSDTQGQNEIRVRPQITIANESKNSVPIKQLSVRYYLTMSGEDANPATTSEGDASFTGVGGGDIADLTEWQVVPISPVARADAYAETTFPRVTSSLAPGERLSVVFTISFPDFAPLNQSNDYSFDAAADGKAPYDRITVLLDGVLIDGQAPGN